MMMKQAPECTLIGDRTAGSGYQIFDTTVSRSDIFVPGLSLRAGVKDAFNAQATYLTQLPNGIITSVFPGRSAWIEVSWKR